MADRKVRVLIEARDNASKKLRDVGRSVGGLEKNLKGAISPLQAFGALAAAVGASQIGKVLVAGLNDAVQASARYESAATRLAVALANQGENTRDTRKDLLDFAAGLQRASLATETQVLGALAQAKALGASTEAAKKLTQAATDLASATGVDMETAFRQVNRTLGGYAGELGEIFPELKQLTAEQLRAGEAADVLARKVGGAGKAGADTFAGSVNNLRSALDQLQVKVGGPLAEVFQGFINRILLPGTDAVNDQAGAWASYRVAVLEAGAATAKLAGILADLIQSPIGRFFTQVAAAGISSFTKQVLQANEIVKAFGQEGTSELGNRMRALAAEFEAAARSSRDFGEDLQNVGAGGGAGLDATARALEDVQQVLTDLGATTEFKPFGEVEEDVGALVEGIRQVSAALQDSAVSGSRADAILSELIDKAREIPEIAGGEITFGIMKPEEMEQALAELEALTLDANARAHEALLQQNADHLEVKLEQDLEAIQNRLELEQEFLDQFRNTQLEGSAALQKAEDAIFDASLKRRQLAINKFNKERLKGEKQVQGNIRELAFQLTIELINLAGVLFGKQKEAAIAKALINTYQGFTKALAEGGLAGILTGAIVLAAGLAQVARIRSQNFDSGGGFQRGGIVPGIDTGRDSVVIAARPGEAVLPKELTDLLLRAAGRPDARALIPESFADDLVDRVERIAQPSPLPENFLDDLLGRVDRIQVRAVGPQEIADALDRRLTPPEIVLPEIVFPTAMIEPRPVDLPRLEMPQVIVNVPEQLIPDEVIQRLSAPLEVDVTLNVEGDLSGVIEPLIDEVNAQVNRGAVRLVSTQVRTPRSRRR